jgi:hypothetical protein
MLSKEQLRELRRFEIQLTTGNLQLGFNADLKLQVIIQGDSWNYTAQYIQNGNLIGTYDIGLGSKLGYWDIESLVNQEDDLPAELRLNTK